MLLLLPRLALLALLVLAVRPRVPQPAAPADGCTGAFVRVSDDVELRTPGDRTYERLCGTNAARTIGWTRSAVVYRRDGSWWLLDKPSFPIAVGAELGERVVILTASGDVLELGANGLVPSPTPTLDRFDVQYARAPSTPTPIACLLARDAGEITVTTTKWSYESGGYHGWGVKNTESVTVSFSRWRSEAVHHRETVVAPIEISSSAVAALVADIDDAMRPAAGAEIIEPVDVSWTCGDERSTLRFHSARAARILSAVRRHLGHAFEL